MSGYEIVSIVIGAVGLLITTMITVTIHYSGKKSSFLQYYERIVSNEEYSSILAILADTSDDKEELWKDFISKREHAILLENFLSFLDLVFYEFRYLKICSKALNETIIQPILTDPIIHGLIVQKNKECKRYGYLKKRLDAAQRGQK